MFLCRYGEGEGYAEEEGQFGEVLLACLLLLPFNYNAPTSTSLEACDEDAVTGAPEIGSVDRSMRCRRCYGDEVTRCCAHCCLLPAFVTGPADTFADT